MNLQEKLREVNVARMNWISTPSIRFIKKYFAKREYQNKAREYSEMEKQHKGEFSGRTWGVY